MPEQNKIYLGDCLEIMKKIPNKSINMILCDLPYGVTKNSWDSIVDLKLLWAEYERIIKDNGAIILTAIQPFSSILTVSNLKLFKYEWVWKKSRVTNVLNAKKQCLRQHETILVFYKHQCIYNAQGVSNCDKRSGSQKSSNYGKIKQTADGKYDQKQTGWPRSILEFNSAIYTEHPTQKPIALFEYLIKTYTNENALVLDNCIGSGTTAIACINTNRNFIGIEKEEKYFTIANEKINKALHFDLF